VTADLHGRPSGGPARGDDDDPLRAAVSAFGRGPANETLEALLSPASIAIVGASTDPGSPGGKLIEILRQYDYEGKLFPVNPKGGESIGGIPAYADLRSLPEVPDLCIIVVAIDRVPRILDECREIGVGAALVLSSGANERTDYATNRRALLDAIRGSALRVAGPNSVGILNLVNGMAATWSPVVDLQQGATRPADGPVAIVAQSGGLGFGLLGEATRRGLGARYVVSTGNEADVSSPEVMNCLLSDDKVRVVLVFLEGLDRPSDLVSTGRIAREANKFVVVAKVGRSLAAKEASALHTAHLAGSDVAYEALFREFGFIRAADAEEMVDYALTLTRCPTMKGNGIGIATLSGGAGIWVADACEAVGLTVPELTTPRQRYLADEVGTYGSTRNPVDVTGPKVSPTGMVDTVRTLIAQESIHAVVVILPTLSQRTGARLLKSESAQLTRDLVALQDTSGKPVVLFTYTGTSAPWLEDLSASGMAWYTSPVRLARSLRCLVDRATEVDSAEIDVVSRRARLNTANKKLSFGRDPVLLEHEAKSLLRSYGIRTTREVLIRSVQSVGEQAAKFGSTVAMKAQTRGVIHKAELGLVALDVPLARVEDTFGILWQRSVEMTGLEPDGILVQEMIPKGLEMIVGTLSDPDFGPLVMVGVGGSGAEQIHDRVFCLAPVDTNQAARAIAGLRTFHQSIPANVSANGPLDSLAALMAGVSRLAWENRNMIKGFELNPVMVLPDGVIVVDATGETNAR
jgi:acyl-CoA synthetase (NDP forming)